MAIIFRPGAKKKKKASHRLCFSNKETQMWWKHSSFHLVWVKRWWCFNNATNAVSWAHNSKVPAGGKNIHFLHTCRDVFVCHSWQMQRHQREMRSFGCSYALASLAWTAAWGTFTGVHVTPLVREVSPFSTRLNNIPEILAWPGWTRLSGQKSVTFGFEVGHECRNRNHKNV